MDIVWFLVIGALAGWLAGLLMRGGGFGIIGNIVVGIIGAMVAGFLIPKVGFSFGEGTLGAILNSAAGAVLVLVVVGLFKKGS